MGDKSKIEWTDATWNPIRGCSKVSSGCAHCYAERQAARFSGKGEPYEGVIKNGMWNGQIKLVTEHLNDPLKWKKPRRIFVNSMSDLFHEDVKDEWIDQIFAVMALSPQHTFQILTKRPERMREYLYTFKIRLSIGIQGKYWAIWPLPNVWLGTSMENQDTADIRFPPLQATPAAVRFLSVEPLLTKIDLGNLTGIHWVIVGGESGPGARPLHPDWVRSIRDQCQAAGVPFFFKQWGEYILNLDPIIPIGFNRIGKKAAGRELDGRTWDEMPEARKAVLA